jgi:hypothetical protein
MFVAKSVDKLWESVQQQLWLGISYGDCQQYLEQSAQTHKQLKPKQINAPIVIYYILGPLAISGQFDLLAISNL